MASDPACWDLRVVGESILLNADGRESDLSGKSKRFALLVFMALPAPGGWVRRDVLLATFWQELDNARARNALRVTLHQLRNALGAHVIRTIGDEQVSLDPAFVRLDYVEMLEAFAKGDPLRWLSRASLGLVPGLHVSDASPFDDWLDAQRATFNAQIAIAAWRFADDVERTGDLRAAIAAARAASRLARSDEAGINRLMSLLDRVGDRAGALAEYEAFEQWLRTELDVAPAPETVARVQQIRERATPNDTAARPPTATTQRAEATVAADAPKRRMRSTIVALAAVIVLGAAGVFWAANSKTHARIDQRMPVVRHVPDPRAYRISLNAAWLLGRRSRDELLKARELYTQALEIDPEWSDLWRGLAAANGSLAYRHFVDYRTGFIESEHAASEAIARAPADGAAYIERAMARVGLGDRVGARADVLRAEALTDTTDFHMQSLIGTWWQWDGVSLDSALYYTERARRLAPWDRQVAINVMQIVGCMDSVRTLAAARHVLDMDGNEREALETYAWTLAQFGRWDEATRAYEQLYARWVAKGASAQARALSGEARFRATVRELRLAVYHQQRLQPPATPPLLEARIALYEDLGMRDSAIAALNSVRDEEDAHHANMMCAPNLREFRRDPRVLAIVRKRGWPLAEFADTH